MHFPVLHIDLVFFKIHPQTIQHKHLFLNNTRCFLTQCHPYSGKQLIDMKGLGNIIIRPQIQCLHLFPFLPSGRYYQNRHLTLGTNLTQHLAAVNIRQSQIQQNQIRIIAHE